MMEVRKVDGITSQSVERRVCALKQAEVEEGTRATSTASSHSLLAEAHMLLGVLAHAKASFSACAIRMSTFSQKESRST